MQLTVNYMNGCTLRTIREAKPWVSCKSVPEVLEEGNDNLTVIVLIVTSNIFLLMMISRMTVYKFKNVFFLQSHKLCVSLS